jgi:penicillin-binding protein 1A
MKKRLSLFKKVMKFGLICLGLLILFLLFLSRDLPNPNELGNKIVSQSVKIYDRTGKTLLYNAGQAENRQVVALQDIPEYVKLATLAAEDHNFYNHGPIEIKSIFRSILTNILKLDKSQGASTITQQLARNAFLGREKTYVRKLREIILAFYLESKYSKDQILEYYLNQVPYGYNAYGIESASQLYYNKSVKTLNIVESAYLASLLKSPSFLSPFGDNRERLDIRKN